MSDFVAGAFVAWYVLAVLNTSDDLVGLVVVTILVFCGGWNWHKFAAKKGWLKEKP